MNQNVMVRVLKATAQDLRKATWKDVAREMIVSALKQRGILIR